ncbi:MAG: hypothetical protein V3U18_02045 [Alphaproteobacteria bacterium]
MHTRYAGSAAFFKGRRRRELAGLKVLFTTGDSRDKHLPADQESDGRTALIGKPYRKQGLAHALRQLLDDRGAHG